MASYEYDSQNQELKRIAGGTLYADCPIGSYIPFGGTVIPIGWLLCNGQAVSRTDYADLFAVIGTAYGGGDGSTTFNIPDLREAVPKGAGLTGKSNNHMDADGLAVGEFLDDRMQEHTHTIPYSGDASVGTGNYMTLCQTQNNNGTRDSGANSGRTGATTEVKSVGSNYIIKAKQIGVPADFAPVDIVASGNMRSVTSGAVADEINSLNYIKELTNTNYTSFLQIPRGVYSIGTSIYSNYTDKPSNNIEGRIIFIAGATFAGSDEQVCLLVTSGGGHLYLGYCYGGTPRYEWKQII